MEAVLFLVDNTNNLGGGHPPMTGAGKKEQLLLPNTHPKARVEATERVGPVPQTSTEGGR